MKTSSAICLLLAGVIRPVQAEGSVVKLPENPRIVYCGDSITGQGGGWMGVGYCFQADWALKEAYPGSAPSWVALGGSGLGVASWLGVEEKSRTEERFLDVKTAGVKENLDQPADALVVMLGMNDVLAPYVGGSDDALDLWIGKYRELVTALQARVKPKVTGIGTVTMYTEDPKSYKNKQIARMNERIRTLAKELGAVVVPSGEACWEVQEMGRQLKPDFHITRDYIHPNVIGNQAVAVGMLRGLGEKEAADRLMEERIKPALLKEAGMEPRISYEITPQAEPDTFRIRTWWPGEEGGKPTMKVVAPEGWTVTPAETQGTSGDFVVKGKPDRWNTVFKVEGKLGSETRQAEVALPTPWLVATGLVQRWNGSPPEYDPQQGATEVDTVIEQEGDFTAAIDMGGGKTLEWRRLYPSVNLTGGADPANLDYAAVTNGDTFEGGYAARWIHSDRKRPVKIDLATKNLGTRLFLTIWLNGKVIYQKDLTNDPERKTNGKVVVDAELQAGDNALVIKSNHVTWQWVFSANLRGAEGDDLNDLRFRTEPNAK